MKVPIQTLTGSSRLKGLILQPEHFINIKPGSVHSASKLFPLKAMAEIILMS